MARVFLAARQEDDPRDGIMTDALGSSNLPLVFIVFGAFLLESIVGFGSTVLTVTLGAHFLGLDALLVRFIPLNLLLSSLLLARAPRQAQLRFLGRGVLPAVGVGAALGLALTHLQGSRGGRLAFGLFIVTLALLELRRQLRPQPSLASPLPPVLHHVLLVLGGVVHGLFGSGGPVIVYVLSRRLTDRSAMRATLAVLWILLNGLLLAQFLVLGRLSLMTLRDSALLLPSLALGVLLGDRLHARLPERPFRLLVYLVLLFAGSALVLRTWLASLTSSLGSEQRFSASMLRDTDKIYPMHPCGEARAMHTGGEPVSHHLSSSSVLQPASAAMSTTSHLLNHPITKTLQSDATEAAWRTAGNQLVKLTRDPLVGVLSRHLGPDDEAMRKKIADFLTTEAGTALLAGLLSIGLSAMPTTAGDAPQRLARELRVKAMADMGDLVADVVMGPLRQVMAFYLQDLANAPAPAPELTTGSADSLPLGVAAPEGVTTG
ncbi:MAG: sulfite exporter TauE/SafE family protein [Polyangiaceae bacterium]|jgi:hypothetical protein|nr:sulfite exporter TauE/SafE family protein [Polyangiaceae bacterium]